MPREKKPKTKKCDLGTLATESPDGSWTWDTNNFSWRWRPGFGVNTFLLSKSGGEPRPVRFAKDLNTAVIYSWGVVAGFSLGTQAAAPPQKRKASEEEE
jgi:hypothetical protein